MEEFKVRKAEYEDVSSIMNIINIAVENLPQKSLYYADDENFIRDHIENKGFSLVATKEEKVAGFLVVRFPKDDEDNLGRHVKNDIDLNKVAHMESAAVLPEFRNKGIQTLLLTKAEERLQDTDYCYYMGTVSPNNEYSLKSLKSRNYEIIDTVPKYGGWERHIIYKKV